MPRLQVLLILLSISAAVLAQTPATSKSDAEIARVDREAQTLYEQQNLLAALPLYRELLQKRPTSNIYREQLAMCLLAKAVTATAEEGAQLQAEAKSLLLQAEASGDHSNLLQTVLEKLNSNSTASPAAPSPAQQTFARAEKAFSSGDLENALLLYKQANQEDPTLYAAPLYAGDTEYKLKHYDSSGQWYAKAIAINPDVETAYRYWGDVLMHSGDQKSAKAKFIDGIVAQPYTKSSWLGLQQWAQMNHTQMVFPQINLPTQPVPDAKGNVNVTLNASSTDSPATAAWLIYAMVPSTWRSTEFKKHYPNETAYRHSLAEQAESIRSALAVIKEQKIPEDKLDATFKSLLSLEKDGMLECWILLNHADQGIAHDYAAYRVTHRQLLHLYIDKYIVPF